MSNVNCVSSAQPEYRVKISGEQNIANAEELRELLLPSLERDCNVVLDSGGVTACDAAALQLICSLGISLAAHGRRLRIEPLAEAIAAAADEIGLSLGQEASIAQGGIGDAA